MVGEQTGYIVHEFLAADGASEPAMSDPAVELEPALEPEPAVALAPDPALVPTGTIVKTLGEGARCRIDATYSAGVITVLAEGAIVELGDVAADGWQAVVCEGQTGYVHLDYLLIDGAPPVEPAPDLDPIPETGTTLPVMVEATASVAATVPAPLPSLAATKPPPPTLDATFTVKATPVDTAPAVTADGTLTGMATVSGTNGEGLRCRSGASYSATTITVLPEGDKVGVTGAAVGEWQPVACGGLNGYVHTDFITIAESAAAPAGARLAVTEDETFTAAAVTGMATVSGTDGGGLRCRSAASYSGMTITMLAEGSSVSLRGGLTGEWQAVTCAGQNGFAHNDYLTQANTGSTSSTTTVSATSTGSAKVTGTDGGGLRCRSGAGYSAGVIAVLAEGTSVTLRGAMVGEWQPVTCAGQNGFVHSDFLSSGGGTTNPGNGGGTVTGSARVVGTNGDGLRCRSEATSTASTITTMSEGSTVQLRGSATGQWQPVLCAGQNGFAHTSYLSFSGTAPNPTPAPPATGGLRTGDHARVTSSLNLRYDASYSAGVAAVAPAGTVVGITGGMVNGFYKVNWDGLNGYMFGTYLTWTDAALSVRGGSGSPGGGDGGAGNGTPSTTGSAMANFAMQYLGYPYRWATAGPSSFDCSGFTYWVTKNVTGRDIGRGLFTQVASGTPVSYSNLRPGDLVFFQNTYTWGLSHSGIYIGNNQFIHAENENTGVKISDITSQYYASRWYGAVRMG
jgi:cell wall-associated NlpC family hydrolase